MDKLFVNRMGLNDEAYMKTNYIVNRFEKYSKVIWRNNNLETCEKNITIKDSRLLKPKRLKINIQIKEINENVENNNILGKNSYIFIENELLKIPIEVATEKKLNYYFCNLIEDGDIFKLNNKSEIQNFNISIGQNYFKDYILQNGLGNGIYIETHDTPHFHQPLNSNCSGYLIIGKIKRDELIITAFKIPFGKAIYIPPNTYHCDACLVGEYNVIYTITEKYKTYLIYNENNKNFVDVQFIDHSIC